MNSVEFTDKLNKMSMNDYTEVLAKYSVEPFDNPSETEYFATLDLSFQSERVRSFLQRNCLTYVDIQAPPILLLPLAFRKNTINPTDKDQE